MYAPNNKAFSQNIWLFITLLFVCVAVFFFFVFVEICCLFVVFLIAVYALKFGTQDGGKALQGEGELRSVLRRKKKLPKKTKHPNKKIKKLNPYANQLICN